MEHQPDGSLKATSECTTEAAQDLSCKTHPRPRHVAASASMWPLQEGPKVSKREGVSKLGSV